MVKTRSDQTTKPAAAPKGKEAQAAHARRLVAIQSAIALTLLAGIYWAWDSQVVPRLRLQHLHIHSVPERLAFTLRHQIPGVLAVTASIAHVSLIRCFTHAINPLSGNEHLIERANNILINTVEQFILNIFNVLILSTYLPESQLKLIPLLSVTFFVGRIAFLAGYLRAPVYRTVGFQLTFLPTLVCIVYNIYFALTLGYTYHLGAGIGKA